jgi:hypothetical protein
MHLRADIANGCVNGLPGSPFTQFAYCGAPRFFAAANAAIRAGRLAVPPLGTGVDGRPCPTTRDFSVVDQDESDNLPTTYLALPDGRTAQDSPANRASLPGATALTNGSDNGLLDNRIDPALHCQPFTAPDLSAAGTPAAALALNELQAAARQATPVALVPPVDPTTQVDGRTSILKTDLYRAGGRHAPDEPADGHRPRLLHEPGDGRSSATAARSALHQRGRLSRSRRGEPVRVPHPAPHRDVDEPRVPGRDPPRAAGRGCGCRPSRDHHRGPDGGGHDGHDGADDGVDRADNGADNGARRPRCRRPPHRRRVAKPIERRRPGAVGSRRWTRLREGPIRCAGAG